jgi:hypothetical protein
MAKNIVEIFIKIIFMVMELFIKIMDKLLMLNGKIIKLLNLFENFKKV